MHDVHIKESAKPLGDPTVRWSAAPAGVPVGWWAHFWPLHPSPLAEPSRTLWVICGHAIQQHGASCLYQGACHAAWRSHGALRSRACWRASRLVGTFFAPAPLTTRRAITHAVGHMWPCHSATRCIMSISRFLSRRVAIPRCVGQVPAGVLAC